MRNTIKWVIQIAYKDCILDGATFVITKKITMQCLFTTLFVHVAYKTKFDT